MMTPSMKKFEKSYKVKNREGILFLKTLQVRHANKITFE